MLDPKNVAAFSAVIDCGGFEKAATALCITQSAISQRIKSLEDTLTQTLLIRSSPPRPTPAGSFVLKYAKQLDQLEFALKKDLSPNEQPGWLHIAIAINADTLATWLLKDCLAPWCQDEQVLLDIKVDDQDQTHHLLQSGAVIGCISASSTPPKGCRSVPLGSCNYLAVCSPSFKKRWFGKKITQNGFLKAPYSRFNNKDFLQHNFLMQYFDLDADQLPFHSLPSSEGYLEWIKLGMTWGMVPRAQIRTDIADGALIQLTPHQELMIPLYWHYWGIGTQLTRSITQAITEAATRAHD